MPKPPRDRRATARGRRLLTVICVTVALLTPAVFSTVKYWGGTSSDLAFAQAEEQGVSYLRPLTALVSVLADSESAAVVGRPVNADALHRAVNDVALADQRDGRSLGVHDIWVNLQSEISKLSASTNTGKAAYSGYSAVVDQTLFLTAKVGDTSNLILDPQLDSYYLMDVSLLRLPTLLADSGRMADLNTMRISGTGGVDLSQVLVARDRIATESAATQTGLSKSFDATASPTFGPDLLTKVDAFRTAIGVLAPSTALVDQPLPLDEQATEAGRTVLAHAVMQLEGGVLDQLNGLLQTRLAGTTDGRSTVLLVWAAGVGLALAVLLLVGGVLRQGGRQGGRQGSGVHAGPHGHAHTGAPDSSRDGVPEAGEGFTEDGSAADGPFGTGRAAWRETTGARR